MNFLLNRRRFLLVLGAMAAGVGLPGCRGRQGPDEPRQGHSQPSATNGAVAGSARLDEFLALSAILTGVARLDREVGLVHFSRLQVDRNDRSVLDSLLAASGLRSTAPPGNVDDLASLGIFEQKDMRALADRITLCWYRGNWSQEGPPTRSGFADALAWQVLPFTKPPGICGGGTGYWALPPVER